MNRSPWLSLLALGATFALAGCESKVSIDLAVTDTDALEQVNLVIEGVDLLDEDSEVHALTTDLDMPIDLRTVLDGQTLRLIDRAEIDNGHYTGLRLHLANSVEKLDAGARLSHRGSAPAWRSRCSILFHCPSLVSFVVV